MPAGLITDIQCFVAGMARWASLAEGIPQLQPGSELQLAVWWRNTGSEPARAYVEGKVTRPDGTVADLVSITGAIPDIRDIAAGAFEGVQMQPVVLDQIGSYQGGFRLMREEAAAAPADLRVDDYFFAYYEASGEVRGSMGFDLRAIYPPITSAPAGSMVSLWVRIANYGGARGQRQVKCLYRGAISSHTPSLDPGEVVWVQFVTLATAPGTMEYIVDYGTANEQTALFLWT